MRRPNTVEATETFVAKKNYSIINHDPGRALIQSPRECGGQKEMVWLCGVIYIEQYAMNQAINKKVQAEYILLPPIHKKYRPF